MTSTIRHTSPGSAAAPSASPDRAPDARTGMPGVTAVGFRSVTRRYGETVALDAVDLRIAAGETVALLGPNGAGKSTAIALMLGLIGASAGHVSILGQEPRTAVRAGRVGAMLQESGLPTLARVGELIELVRDLSPRPMATAEVLQRAGLGKLAGRRTETLSGGEQQRVRFAMAIAGNPDLLFLDEPTVAMDVESRRAFWSDMHGFAEEGRTILFATHYLEEADQVASRIVVLDRGRIVADGTAAEIKSSGARRRRISFRLERPDRAVLGALPGVSAVAVSGEAVVLETTDSDRTAQALFASSLAARDVEITGPDLESAFLDLVAAS